MIEAGQLISTTPWLLGINVLGVEEPVAVAVFDAGVTAKCKYFLLYLYSVVFSQLSPKP